MNKLISHFLNLFRVYAKIELLFAVFLKNTHRYIKKVKKKELHEH
jgi:hypothetical protein